MARKAKRLQLQNLSPTKKKAEEDKMNEEEFWVNKAIQRKKVVIIDNILKTLNLNIEASFNHLYISLVAKAFHCTRSY